MTDLLILIVEVYVGGAVATAAICTSIEHYHGEVNLRHRTKAVVLWPIFWPLFFLTPPE